MMDDGEVDSPNSSGLLGFQDDYSHFLDDSSISQSDWDNLIGTQICSHKHICNPGPDNTHTHTCEHTHTQTIGSGDEEKLTKKRRPSGNKEAVRKYREKQKAVKVNLEVRNAELEKENQRIPDLLKEIQRLRKKLQEQRPRQDALENALAENKRLKALLSHFRREIDSEMDGGSHQKLHFSPAKVDRRVDHSALGVGNVSSGGVQCAAPVPCFPARPVGQAGLPDIERTESLGWHAECELLNTVCHSPDSNTDVIDRCTSSGAELGTHFRTEGSTLPSAVLKQRVQSSSKAPRRRSDSVQQSVPVPYHPSGVPCAAPAPCFNPSRPSVQQGSGRQAQHESFNWQGGCELMNGIHGVAEITEDSSLNSASLSAEDVIQSSNTTPRQEPSLASSKLRMEGNSSAADIFSSGCYFEGGAPGATATAAIPRCWDHHSNGSPNGVTDSWLEHCDYIDGVCQAHMMNAAHASPHSIAFRDPKDMHSCRPTLQSMCKQ